MAARGAGPTGPTLGRGAEFDLIRGFLGGAGPLPTEVLVGPGDDAAVLTGGWVFSTDLSVEGVHFRRSWVSDAEIGYRSTVAALSDLAAMAASPLGVLVSVAAPREGDVSLDAVMQGVHEALAAHSAGLLGGDLSTSPGPLVLDLVALGRTEAPVLRSGASAGDEVWVTGSLGASAAAVLAWGRGVQPSPEARAAFARPTARVAEARLLNRNDLMTACIDLSDGLAGDTGHLAAASGVKIVLEAGRVPIHPGAAGADAESLGLALHGGEDYELCFTAPAGSVGRALDAGELALPLTRVGRVEAGEGVWIERDGEARRLERGGFDHWEGTS